MQKKSKLALGAAALVAVAAVIGAVQMAHADRGMMQGMGWGSGHGRHMSGPMDGPMHMPMMGLQDRYDGNKDGKVSQAEVDQNRTALLGEFDADKTGGLTLKEFEGLWLKARHDQMVREFQSFDRNGDGNVTLDEYKAPLGNVVAMFDRNGDKLLGSEDRPEPGNGGWGGRGRHHRMMKQDVPAQPGSAPGPDVVTP